MLEFCMSARGDLDYLDHIRESIEAIESFLRGVDEAQFYESRLIQSAVVREIEIIGEAVKRLSPQFRQAHPSIPWSRVAKMRDKLIHHYFGLDLPLVWETTQKSIPDLKTVLKRSDS
jgi:uncharacterized protein with HEPN domain